MPSEEGRQVLKLLAEGKIDAEQAYRLLAALGDIRGERPAAAGGPAGGAAGHARAPGRGRLLRIRITEGGEQKVNIAVPLTLARLGRIGGVAEKLRKRYDLDLAELLRGVQESAGGRIVDVVGEDENERVEIFIE